MNFDVADTPETKFWFMVLRRRYLLRVNRASQILLAYRIPNFMATPLYDKLSRVYFGLIELFLLCEEVPIVMTGEKLK